MVIFSYAIINKNTIPFTIQECLCVVYIQFKHVFIHLSELPKMGYIKWNQMLMLKACQFGQQRSNIWV